MTWHGAQGLTIDEEYTMHEFDRIDQKLKYVALSRFKKHQDINVMNIQ
jgi:hypothetical protein